LFLTFLQATGRFVMSSMITNIYNKKTKGPSLKELFTATGKLKKFFLTTRDVQCVHHGWHGTRHIRVNMLMCVWQQLEYCIDVCRVTRGAQIKHLLLSKKNFFSFPVATNNSIKVGPLVFLL